MNAVAIPHRLNIFLLGSAAAAAVLLLYAASRTESWFGFIAAALGFSFINNTLFSLLHEAVHSQFHPNPKLNDLFGRIAALFFPTSYSMQRVFHLGHHQRNRTAVEQFDYLHPGDNKFFKYAQWYSILTGLYWLFVPVGCVVYLLAPGILRARALRSKESKLAQQSSADAMFSDLEKASPTWIRIEIIVGAAVQIGLFYVFDLTVAGWAACYAAFAVNWSSLQYADHAWSALDVRNGAWNLRVNRIVQYLFLNYHHHLAHHQHPEVPWLYLHRYVDFAGPRPRFLSVYLSMWRGPRPLLPEKSNSESSLAPWERARVRAHAKRDHSSHNVPSPQSSPRGRGGEFLVATLVSPWWAELTCLRFNYSFIKRHRRYLIVFLLILWHSLFQWRATRVVRFTYAFAQRLDDILDGDFCVEGEPANVVECVIRQLETGVYEDDPMGQLAQWVASELTHLRSDRDEPLAELITLLRVMRFDRERMRQRLLLSRSELAEHYRQTFQHSVNLMLIGARAELRAQDAEDLVRAFGWCSTLRDLPEDIEKGLFNIPREVIERAYAEEGARLDYASLTATVAVRQWIEQLHGEGKENLDRFAAKLGLLKSKKGGRILAIFMKSMDAFHARYRKAHPEFFQAVPSCFPAPLAVDRTLVPEERLKSL